MAAIPAKTDITIIGGGPAGSTAAALLAQKGFEVVLLEKQQHPRFTVGENLIPHFWKYTDMTGASETIANEGFVRKVGGTVVWRNTIRQIAFKDFGYGRQAFHVERDRFDFLLLQHAKQSGARVFEKVTALELDLENEGKYRNVVWRAADGETGTLKTRFIIDASGQSSIIARKQGTRSLDDGFKFMSMWGHFKNARYVGYDGKAHPHETVMTVHPTTFVTSISEIDDRGWCWHIPLRKVTSVGLVLPVDFLRERKRTGLSGEALFLDTLRNLPRMNRLLEEATLEPGSFNQIRDYSYKVDRVTGPGWFLVGDAAGFVDPIFSVGVVAGMYGAYSAAWAVERSLSRPEKEAHNRALFEQQLQGRLEVSRNLALPCYVPDSRVGQQTQAAFKFESSLEQELMFVVSVLTTRSGNLEDLAGKGQVIPSDRYREIPEIQF